MTPDEKATYIRAGANAEAFETVERLHRDWDRMSVATRIAYADMLKNSLKNEQQFTP